jgi:hypothetical protein
MCLLAYSRLSVFLQALRLNTVKVYKITTAAATTKTTTTTTTTKHRIYMQ